jgi:RNA polymerase sigma factor (TIGR02999 family)
MSHVTQILAQIGGGDPTASQRLLSLVYDELRQLAAAKLANGKPGQTLQATALVDEAYVRQVNVEHVQDWESRAHFFGATAEAMRRILVENARRKQTQKRGGGWQRQPLEAVAAPETHEELLALDAALEQRVKTTRTRAILSRGVSGSARPSSRSECF